MDKMGMVRIRVLVKADEAPEKSDGGIFLPKQSDVSEDDRQIYSHSGTGEVVSKSSQVEGVEVGDRVFFGNYVGAPIKLNGEQYLMMKEEDIQATLTE